MPKATKEDPKSITFNHVREMVRKEIEKRYGGVAKFLNSEKGKEFGGMKIKIYLYDTGPVNFAIISKLCKYFGLGKFTRKIVVSRSVSYCLTSNPVTEKIP